MGSKKTNEVEMVIMGETQRDLIRGHDFAEQLKYLESRHGELTELMRKISAQEHVIKRMKLSMLDYLEAVNSVGSRCVNPKYRERNSETGYRDWRYVSVLSVAVYPTEFGLERMKHEEMHGPATDVVDEKKEDNGDEEKEDEDVKNERLCAYLKSTLKYYFAVAECDSSATADYLYSSCDGIELVRSSIKLDLRFIPDSMDFNHPPLELQALQMSKVTVSWDEDEPHRVKTLNLQFSPGQERLDIRCKDHIKTTRDVADPKRRLLQFDVQEICDNFEKGMMKALKDISKSHKKSTSTRASVAEPSLIISEKPKELTVLQPEHPSSLVLSQQVLSLIRRTNLAQSLMKKQQASPQSSWRAIYALIPAQLLPLSPDLQEHYRPWHVLKSLLNNCVVLSFDDIVVYNTCFEKHIKPLISDPQSELTLLCSTERKFDFLFEQVYVLVWTSWNQLKQSVDELKPAKVDELDELTVLSDTTLELYELSDTTLELSELSDTEDGAGLAAGRNEPCSA
ncbi:hypothetical protein F2Q69_00002914 [Brassica cretica]|uniref:ESF1 RRM domain-containing protein n=1 Tax=Brassica cretica TaxID=69181 RepID=A0A8S9PBG5_BRACR|nr:hypothetical protein F2Q69_00002914 [Brassica cretica]